MLHPIMQEPWNQPFSISNTILIIPGVLVGPLTAELVTELVTQSGGGS